MERWLWVAVCLAAGYAVPLPHEMDSEQTRKLLGSSVVTSVSVIMDHGNGTKTYITDGDVEKKPQVVGTPGTLLSPDRYEFYSFGEDGELVKKLMTLDQIQSLIAGGDELDSLPVYDPQPLIDNTQAEGVHKVLESVQNVLKGELQAAKVNPKLPMPLPDDSWSILLPGFLNSDLDLKESHLPPKTETSTAKISTSSPHLSNKDPISTRKPTQSTTVRSTSRPTSQTTVSQQASTTLYTQQSTKPVTESRPTTAYSTSPPYVKTTVPVSNKSPSQKPQTTSKKPILSTKKPYISETPLVKVSLASTQKFESTTKPATSSKFPTTVVEERTPSTKVPETKKPMPEKQKPSGIPTITHYLPISSMSPSSSTSPSLPDPTTLQKLSSTSKEPLRVTTTKRPSTFPTSQTTIQKATKRPIQNKLPIMNNKTQQINSSQTEKLVMKNPKPIASATTTTRIQDSTTPAPTTTAVKATTVPIVSNEQLSTSTEKLETHPETVSESMSTTPMPVNDSVLPDQDKYVLEKHSGLAPQNNLIGENSNIINTKLRPSVSPTVMNNTPNTSETVTPSSTPFPEKFTTFSYTSKITPNGEIITISQPSVNSTQVKSTTGTSFETTMISTKLPNINNLRTTEKPVERVTNLPQQSSKPMEAIQDQILVSSSMQPTTYHPQNFSFLSNKNQVHSLSSTTPVSTTVMTHSTTEELKKQSTTITVPMTERPTYNSTYTIRLHTLSNSSTAAAATTVQSIMKPTTLVDNLGETTLAATTPSSNVTSETTINDSTSYPTEEMPLQEIPLKIYESLKENVSGAQELLTTIMSENLSTTPGKVENYYSTNYEVTAPTTTTTTDKAITIFDLISSTMIPQNNLVIINNSEPQILEKNALPLNNGENDLNTTTTNEPTQFSTETPVDRNISANEITSQYEATTFSTTIPANNSEPESLETTPNLDSTTIYKDHIVQEGISAVTSILLDQAQKQQAMKQAMLATVIKNDDILDMERIRTTTEEERLTTTISDSTETSVGKFGTDGDQLKSEVRQDEEAELPEKITTVAVETTTQRDKQKTEFSPIKDEIKASNVSSNTQQLKKAELKPIPVVPTKESKLNPDGDHGLKKKNPNKQHVDNTPLLRTSPLPEFTATTERLKLQDAEKPVPKPLSPFVKKPSSVYQSLDNLPPVAIELNPAPYESMGLEASIAFLGEDVRRFADLCNELAFKLWTSISGKGQIASRSLVMSPFAVTSLLAMVFLGARGPTSGQMNDVLRLDDMVTFNPHQVLQNVTESVINSKNNGVATAAFVRELYSDKSKGKILDFYKERVQQYYQGHVEEVTFTTIGDIIRRRTNLLVKRQTLGKVPEYLRGSSLNMRPPLAAFSANIFQTDCEHGSTEGRDGEMYFVVRPSTRQRRLVPVPAVVWRSGFLAGYEPSLDATSVCLGPESVVSTILILPGQQGQVAPGDGLARLEQRLIETTYRRGSWSQILRSLMPRPGLELQIPRFSHRSVLNMTGALQRMGLRDLFNARRADLRGLNGLSNDLHLSDMLQVNTFSTCGEETIGARHHVETYPASPQRIGRDEADHYSSRDLDNAFGDLQLSLRPRQARLPDNPRLRFDRPFLYMIRHNPSGMILHMGRFNPRLLP